MRASKYNSYIRLSGEMCCYEIVIRLVKRAEVESSYSSKDFQVTGGVDNLRVPEVLWSAAT